MTETDLSYAAIKYYGGKYNLQGLSRLSTSLDPKSIVATHYGDWPAPEIFIINQ